MQYEHGAVSSYLIFLCGGNCYPFWAKPFFQCPVECPNVLPAGFMRPCLLDGPEIMRGLADHLFL
jgi:hypothetical protein